MSWQSTNIRHDDDVERRAQFVRCTWIYRRMLAASEGVGCEVLDLTVQGSDSKFEASDSDTTNDTTHLKDSKLGTLLEDLFRHLGNKSNFAVPVKILLPSFNGCFLQENILQDRFVDSAVVSAVHILVNANETTTVRSPEALSSEGLENLVDFGVAALIGYEIRSSKVASEQAHRGIEEDIRCRLQLQWWQHQLPPRRILALVDAGPNWNYYRPVFEAARANRIGLVVIEEPEHWLSKSENSKLCEAFLPLCLDNSDQRLSSRIAEVLIKSGIVVDGVTASSDGVLLPTAQAAEILGLPTQPPSSYLLCRDKHASRQLRTSAIQSVEVATEEQALALSNNVGTQYPLIVKPQHGKSSYGVTKVTAPSQIMPAVSTILSELDDTVVIESYIEGPELDINIVLCRGQLLFCEILDDYPSEGDDDTADPSASFLESAMSSPSALPEDERSMVQAAALEAVLAAGFDTGVFHVEGRVSNSKMHYAKVEGHIDLRPIAPAPDLEAKFVLIEVNARPPAFCCCKASKLTYGIDFYEHWLFAALKDHDRMIALARPFSFPELAGAQYWSHNLIFPTTRGGLFDSDEWESMLASHEDILRDVSSFDSPWKEGEVVPDPMTGRKRFLAYFIICSRGGRQRALEIVANLQRQMGPVLAGGVVRST